MSDIFTDIIAMTSPSGRMSKRFKKATDERVRVALFGPNGLAHPSCPQPTQRENDLRRAKELRFLAEGGMCPRKYLKEAMRLEALHAPQA